MSEAPDFRYGEKYYAPVSPEAPGGQAVADYHFVELASSMEWPKNEFGRPDPEKRPNFKAARGMALGFLDGGKELGAVRDVRPMLLFALAEGGEGGPVAYAKAMDMVVANFIGFWDALHPADDDGDGDFMTRMEELRSLMNAPLHMLALEMAPLARSPQVGVLTLRSFMIAAGKASPRTGEFAPDTDALRAIMREEEEVRAQVALGHAAHSHTVERLRAFDAFLAENDDLDPLDLAPLIEGLETQTALLVPFVGDALPAGEEGGEAEGDAPADPDAAPKAAAGAAFAGPRSGEDAMALLNAIIAYYAAHSRSSPVPLALIALTDLMQADFNRWIGETVSKDGSGAALNLSAVDGMRLDSFSASEGGAPPPPPRIDLRAVTDAVGQLDKTIKGIQSQLEQYIESEACPEDVRKALTMNVMARFGKVGKQTAELTERITPEVPEATEAAETPASGVQIADREGVKRALEAAAAYWERAEPSNPAPGYLRRMRSLVDARFQDITRELIGEKSKEAHLWLEK